MVKMLLMMVNNTRINKNPLILSIRRTAQLTEERDHNELDVPEGTITSALCTAAVMHLGPIEAPNMMVSGSNVCAQTTDDLTNLLTAAAVIGNLNMVKTLLSQGAGIDSESEYFGTPLKAAVIHGQYEVVQTLLGQGANVNYVGGYGHGRGDGTLLRAAVCRDHGSIVRLLLEPKYDIKTSGIDYENALIDAAFTGGADIEQLLFDKGTFANMPDVQHRVLWAASRFGHPHIVQMMLDNGVDVNAQKIGGTRALECAASSGDALLVSLLLENGAVRDFDGSGMDAINRAASNGHIHMVQILLDYGANINSVQCRGRIPFFEAARNQYMSMMRFLLDNGVDLELAACGEDALCFAIQHGHEAVVRMLVEAGVNVDGPPEYSESEPAPILIAIAHGHGRMVNLLLELGAQKVDPMQSIWAEKFRDGTYPRHPPSPPILKP